MSPSPQHSGAGSQPETLPIFPLAGVLLLPRAKLPLNIFEPRYLAMTRDAMHGNRLIGMVQPLDPRDEGGCAPPVYSTGCAGRITSFRETGPERFLIMLTGVRRFAIVDELPLADAGYRRVRASYTDYADDVAPQQPPSALDRKRISRALKASLPRSENTGVDWGVVDRMAGDALLTSLAMMLPFSPSEKQALLEAPDSRELARILVTLMEMLAAGVETSGGEARLQ